MHSSGSANSSRPRQRTFTSCTECRRRKQRCNQAKDRPCNNCSRRYPPVLCTYESSSPPPSHDRVVDLQDHQHPHNHPSHGQHPIGTHQSVHNQIPNPAYSQPVNNPAFIPTTTSADYYGLTYGGSYYNAATTRAFYNDGAASDASSAGSTGQIHAVTTSAGDFLVDDGAPYYSNSGGDSAVFTGGYYDAQGTWVTGQADSGAYAHGTQGDFFYGGADVVRTTRG